MRTGSRMTTGLPLEWSLAISAKSAATAFSGSDVTSVYSLRLGIISSMSMDGSAVTRRAACCCLSPHIGHEGEVDRVSDAVSGVGNELPEAGAGLGGQFSHVQAFFRADVRGSDTVAPTAADHGEAVAARGGEEVEGLHNVYNFFDGTGADGTRLSEEGIPYRALASEGAGVRGSGP